MWIWFEILRLEIRGKWVQDVYIDFGKRGVRIHRKRIKVIASSESGST
jgi:hypothetical protein